LPTFVTSNYSQPSDTGITDMILFFATYFATMIALFAYIFVSNKIAARKLYKELYGCEPNATAEQVYPHIFEGTPARTTTPTQADHATGRYAAAKWVAPIIFFFATFATQAQTYLGSVKLYGNDTVKIYSDYGTDSYYFGADSTKKYCTISKWYSQPDSITPYYFATSLTPKQPQLVPAPRIATSPKFSTGQDTVTYIHLGNETPEFCDTYLRDVADRNTVVIDSFAPTATQEYIALVAEIKAINKEIGYHSRIANKAIRKIQKETVFAVLAYNNCKHRPTIAGYLGLYPIHLLAEEVKNLFWGIAKFGKNQKIKDLTATKKRLLARKKNLNLK